MHNAQLAVQPVAGARHTDTELAAQAARGDDGAFEAIMRRHNRLLFRTARSILKSDADADGPKPHAWLADDPCR